MSLKYSETIFQSDFHKITFNFETIYFFYKKRNLLTSNEVASNLFAKPKKGVPSYIHTSITDPCL